MTTLLIGSTAMKLRGVGNRTPKDRDLFSDDPGAVGDVFWHPSFSPWLGLGAGTRVATLDELYTIKVSHSQWDLNNRTWEKHVYDIVQLKRAGAVLDLELHKLLYKVWEEEHGVKVMDLAQDKSEFFDDAVRRTYDHDSLHDSVAFGELPIYTEVLKDGAEVDIDMRKMRALPLERFVALIKEEIYVTALERIVVPRNYDVSPGAAYWWAFRRTATSLTKGWTARTIMDNAELFIRPGSDYIGRHKAKAHKLVRV
jgi:hypothetical protein